MRQQDRAAGRRFGAGLAVIVLLALGVRVGYLVIAKRGPCPAVYGSVVQAEVPSQCLGGSGFLNDQYWYSTTADLVSHGHFFESSPGHAPLADHPPLQVFVLAATSFAFEHLPLSTLSASPRTVFGGRLETHVREQRAAIAIVGTLVVLLIGLLGRRIGGDRVGLVAALIAAVYPNMWVPDGLLFAEPVARLCVLGALLLALRCRDRARPTTFLALGVVCGLAALARQELILLLPCTALPLVWLARRDGRKRAGAALLLAAAGTALVVGPWALFNLARFHDPVFISTNAGVTLAGANCDSGYYGHTIGLWTALPCVRTQAQEATLGDESQVERAYRTQAIRYVENHESRLPAVIAARVGRTWDLYRPADMVGYEQGENRERAVSWAGLATYYPIAIAALAGVIVLIRRRERLALWLLVAPCLLVTFSTVIASGSVRERADAEPSLVLLAAVAVVALVDRRRSSARDTIPDVASG